MIYGKLTTPFEFMRRGSVYTFPHMPDYLTFPAGTMIVVDDDALGDYNFFSVRVLSDAEWTAGRVPRTQAVLCSPLEALAAVAE